MNSRFGKASRWTGIAAFTLGTLVASRAGAQSFAPEVDSAIADMQTAAGGGLKVRVSTVTNRVTFISAPAGHELRLPLSTSATATDRAASFLGLYGGAFGVDASESVRVTRIAPHDAAGMEHVRLQQMVNGIPVRAGEITVHLRKGAVVAVHAKTLGNLRNVDTVPSITADDARDAARELLVRDLRVSDAELSDPRLEIFNRGHLEGTGAPTRLAWFIEARGADLRELIWVDAKTKIVLLHFSQITDALNRKIYTANSGPTLPGTLLRSEGQGPVGDNDANKAYDFAGDTYNYYLTQHGRDSYDGAGAQLIASVHVCPTGSACPWQNASWDGTQMRYGEGFSVADDVDAHELTHAVTEYSAGLLYYMQSGALNESFSDIFGETVDLGNGAGTDTAATRWQMGEDVPGFGAIRDMEDPTLFDNPGKMSDPDFFCTDTYANDRGGVHFNSGVPNHAYQLMVDGGTYNGLTITGIGLTKAGKIQYRALSEYLVSGSGFLDNYDVVQQSCADLIGTAGITAGDCTEVGEALDAVQMSSPWPCSPTPALPPTFCGDGQGVRNLFFDQLENVTSGLWNTQALSGTNAWTDSAGGFLPSSGDSLLYYTGFALSGTHHFWAYDHVGATDSAVRMTTDVHLPANALLYLRHSYGFDNLSTTYRDGGVIEYSTAGAGGPWTDAGALINGGASYGGTLAAGSSNPLAGRSAFVADSYGYTATRLNLNSLANSNVRFRFRVGTNLNIVAVDDFGWFLDDVEIYTCGPIVFENGFSNGLDGWSAHSP